MAVPGQSRSKRCRGHRLEAPPVKPGEAHHWPDSRAYFLYALVTIDRGRLKQSEVGVNMSKIRAILLFAAWASLSVALQGAGQQPGARFDFAKWQSFHKRCVAPLPRGASDTR